MATSPTGIISLRSRYSFVETVQRLLSAFATHSLKVFATIDQQAEAATVGLHMPPATLIVFGNPKAGTPVMLAQPLSALDLPLKVLVTEATGGEVVVSFNATEYLAHRYTIPAALAGNLAAAERLISAVVAA